MGRRLFSSLMIYSWVWYMFSDYVARILVGAALCVVSCSLLPSCSISEDRSECPCFLVLDFSTLECSSLISQGFDSLRLELSDRNGFDKSECFALDSYVQEYCVSVPKTGVQVSVICAEEAYAYLDRKLQIPKGMDCPKVYMQTEWMETATDGVRRTVSLHKNWCNIELNMVHPELGSQGMQMVSLEGNICGYDFDGSLLEGPFYCLSRMNSDGIFSIKVPRQRDDSLRLRLYSRDLEELKTFPLGTCIIESGYDWTAEDLEDISVSLDFASSSIKVSTSKWKKTLNFDLKY